MSREINEIYKIYDAVNFIGSPNSFADDKVKFLLKDSTFLFFTVE